MFKFRVRNYLVSKVTRNTNIYEEKKSEPYCMNRP